MTNILLCIKYKYIYNKTKAYIWKPYHSPFKTYALNLTFQKYFEYMYQNLGQNMFNKYALG